jgi:hypothetical protein
MIFYLMYILKIVFHLMNMFLLIIGDKIFAFRLSCLCLCNQQLDGFYITLIYRHHII